MSALLKGFSICFCVAAATFCFSTEAAQSGNAFINALGAFFVTGTIIVTLYCLWSWLEG